LAGNSFIISEKGLIAGVEISINEGELQGLGAVELE
jgi:hypothetical protein